MWVADMHTAAPLWIKGKTDTTCSRSSATRLSILDEPQPTQSDSHHASHRWRPFCNTCQDTLNTDWWHAYRCAFDKEEMKCNVSPLVGDDSNHLWYVQTDSEHFAPSPLLLTLSVRSTLPHPSYLLIRRIQRRPFDVKRGNTRLVSICWRRHQLCPPRSLIATSPLLTA